MWAPRQLERAYLGESFALSRKWPALEEYVTPPGSVRCQASKHQNTDGRQLGQHTLATFVYYFYKTIQIATGEN